ncbi:MAG: citramalate synthase [Acidimicrobiales bacterium]
MSRADLPPLPAAVDIYDTTLRDGSQQEGLSLTVDDKLRVAAQLDHLGVAFIEGGWPGANPKDDEFFARAPAELELSTATLVAFGSTRRPGRPVHDDEALAAVLKAGTEAVCIVAKAWDRHVIEALRTDLDEAIAMAAESVAYLRADGRRVFIDAEHFFDGYKADPDFALAVLTAAEAAGAEALVLCDTNGGTLPHEVEEIAEAVRARTSAQLGAHFHNDGGCAVANTLAAVRMGVTQVQGCINGYGERTGNADLCATIGDLSLKMGVRTIEPERLGRLTPVAHHIAELVNIAPDPQQPYVGQSVFATKAGLHTSAIARGRDLYAHVPPETVGNSSRVLLSELAGRSTVILKAEELGLDLDAAGLAEVLAQLKELEHQGYHFEVADGSLELLMRGAGGWDQAFFRLESFRVITEAREDGRVVTEATIKVHIGDRRLVATAEGSGPVNALDSALRTAIGPHHPVLANIHLTDYKVRILTGAASTEAVTRVLIDSTDGERSWTTIGVSQNIIEASWQALADSVVYGLLHSASQLPDRPTTDRSSPDRSAHLRQSSVRRPPFGATGPAGPTT